MKMSVLRRETFIFIILIAVSLVPISYAEKRNEYLCLSPNKVHAVIIRVKPDGKFPDSGEGEVFLRAQDKHEYKTARIYFRYEPRIKWVTNDVAEIFVGLGSPDFYKIFIKASNRKVSPRYNLATAVSPDGRYVILLDMGCIKVFKLFSDKPVKICSVPRLEPMGFMVLQSGKVKFLANDRFAVTYEEPPGERHYCEFRI